MTRFINMVRRVRGIKHELGYPDANDPRSETMSAEILAVGPQFQEVERRWLIEELKKPSFFRHEPQLA